MDECAICLDFLDFEKGEIISLRICNHNFHKKCINLWLEENNFCPLCRKSIEKNSRTTAQISLTPEHILQQNILNPPYTGFSADYRFLQRRSIVLFRILLVCIIFVLLTFWIVLKLKHI